jgi:hypothetical protein
MKNINQFARWAKKALLCVCLLSPALFLHAQGTAGSGLILRVTVGGVSYDYYEGTCGYGTADWGGAFTDNLCLPVAWGYDITPDTLACDSIPVGTLTGKVALVRRGTCNFSDKALFAQKAGAQAVLVANNTADGCTTQNMGGVQPAAGQVTIPVLLVAGNIATQIDNALKGSIPVEVCLLRPDVNVISAFYPVSSMQTPVTEISVDTFGFGVTVNNLGTVDHTNIVVTVSVAENGGQELFSATETIPQVLAGGTDTVSIDFGGALFVPDLPIGAYSITYTTEADSVDAAPVNNRIVDNFYVTQNLFAKDDGTTIGFQPGTFNGDFWATGNVYTMSPTTLENYEFRTAEFNFNTGTAGPPIADVEASFYFFKVNEDVADDWSNFETAELLTNSMELLGVGGYEAPANVTAYQLQQVEVTLFDDPGVSIPLEKGVRYMLVVAYSGTSLNAFNGFNENVVAPSVSTVTYNGQWFLGGFVGNPNAVLRMYLDLVSKTDDKPLPETAMNIVPNPVRETLNLAIDFEKPTDATITIADISGRVLLTQDRSGLTNEVLSYPVAQLAPGTYLARIATKEGTKTKKFVVQE